jgi:hypothetical protein
LYSPDELAWSLRIADEIDNLQAAVTWAVGAGDTTVAMHIGASFVRQAVERPLLGTAHLAEEALAVEGATEHPLRARAMAEAAWGQRRRGDEQRATQTLLDAFEAQRNGARYSVAAYTYATTATAWRGRFHPPDIAREGLEVAEREGSLLAQTGARIAYAVTARLFGNETEGIAQAERSLIDARTLGIPTVVAEALYANGVAWCTADVDRALAYLRESAEISKDMGYTQGLAANFGLLGLLESMHGELATALLVVREQLQLAATDRAAMPTPFYFAPNIFNRCNRPDAIARCDAVWLSDRVVTAPLFDRFTKEAIAEARATLGDDEYDRLARDSADMTLREMHQYLLAEIEALISSQ